MENIVNYTFGAGGFKLGDRVEVLTTRQRGIIIGEVVHLTGCNTYHVLLPKIKKYDRIAIKSYDYLILRKLLPSETVFGENDDLSDDSSFSPKGTNVNAEWITSAIKEGKELIPETDEAIGAEVITISPGTEVWHKIYNKSMTVIYIRREIYSKELEYGLMYMENDKEYFELSRAYALIPMEQRIQVYTKASEKVGSMYVDHEFSSEDICTDILERYGVLG